MMQQSVKITCKFCPRTFKNEQDQKAHILFEHGFLMPNCSTKAYYQDVFEIDKLRTEYWRLKATIEKKTRYYIKKYGAPRTFDFVKTRGNFYSNTPNFNHPLVNDLYNQSTKFRNYISLIHRRNQLVWLIEKEGFVLDR